MSDTARDLIEGAMRLIGALASGENATADEATNGLTALNDLIDGWSTERLVIPNVVREVFALTASQQTYTMGTGGDFNTTRPQKIERALIQFTGQTPAIELPMKILNTPEYAGVILKTITSTFPHLIYSDNAYPTTNISVWPVPDNSNYSIVLYSVKTLSQLSNLSTTLSLPPGYQRALRYALAIEISPEYGKEVSEVIVGIANQAKAEIKRANVEPSYLRCDDALVSRSKVWNYRTGEPQ